MTVNGRDDSIWRAVIKADLDRSAEQLDVEIMRRLQSVRRAALARTPRRYAAWWLPAAITAGACAAMLAFVLLQKPDVDPLRAEDLEFISSADGIEFYRDLEFYEWLAEDAAVG